MIPRIGSKAAATAAVLVLGGAGATAAQVPASASELTAAYSCSVPGVGAENVTAVGALTASPNPAAAGSPVSNVDLTGSWAPTSSGTDQFVVGDITITANVALFGSVTVSCTPSGTQPVAETLTVG